MNIEKYCRKFLDNAIFRGDSVEFFLIYIYIYIYIIFFSDN